MKKNVIILAILLFSALFTQSFAQKNRTLTKGFSMNLSIGIPSEKYGFESDVNSVPDEVKIGPIFGFQFGNRWYIKPQDTYGFGIMVNWADLSLGSKSGSISGTDFTRVALDMSFCEVGPIATVALSDEIAIDGYYNLRPTLFMSIMAFPDNSDNDVTYIGGGASHALGTAIRWKILNFGLEYVFGNITCSGSNSNGDKLGDEKLVVSNFRIKMGVKF